MKHLVLLGLIFGLFSCDRNKYNSFSDTSKFSVRYIDSEGSILVDNLIDISDVKIYHVIDGKNKLFDYSHIGRDTGYFPLVLNTYKEGITTTLIDVKNHFTDTIEAEITKSRTQIMCHKMYRNGKLFYTLPFEPRIDLVCEKFNK